MMIGTSATMLDSEIIRPESLRLFANRIPSTMRVMYYLRIGKAS